MMQRPQFLLVGLVLFTTCTSAHAAMVMYSDSVPVQTTNWSDTMMLPLFDPSLGTLTSVKLTLDGSVSGTAKYESLDASPALIDLNLQATITLQKPDLSNLVQIIPLANVSENASAFDGTVDFDGASGTTFAGLNGSASDMTTLTLPADLALFTGVGNINLPVSGTGSSNGSGAGNLITQFATSAGATAKVVYTFEPVPEPTSFALAGLGMAGLLLAGWRKRRR